MSKKIISILSSVVLGLTLISCNSEVANKKLEKNETKTTQETKQDKKDEDEELQEVIDTIGINKFEMQGDLVDKYGTTYYSVTITNNSDYALKDITYKYTYINVEGNKDTTYLSCYDTILPHETSSQVDCFGSEEMELISVDYTIYNQENDETLYVRYDVKLDKYEFM